MKLFKRLSSIAVIAGAVLVAGCASGPNALTKSMVTSSVAFATTFGLEKYPQAEPEVRISENVICAAANSTNVQPAQIVAQLRVAGITNDTSKFIVNSVLAIYNGVFESYGNDWVKNQVALQGYLEAVCNGLTEALPPPPAAPGRFSSRAPRALPPHL